MTKGERILQELIESSKSIPVIPSKVTLLDEEEDYIAHYVPRIMKYCRSMGKYKGPYRVPKSFAHFMNLSVSLELYCIVWPDFHKYNRYTKLKILKEKIVRHKSFQFYPIVLTEEGEFYYFYHGNSNMKWYRSSELNTQRTTEDLVYKCKPYTILVVF